MIRVELTRDELYALELLRRLPGARKFLMDWAQEMHIAYEMSDKALRDYRYVRTDDGYEIVEGHYTYTACDDCNAPQYEDMSVGYRECEVSPEGVMSLNCAKCDEVSYALRPFVFCDMMMRGIWGDGNTPAA